MFSFATNADGGRATVRSMTDFLPPPGGDVPSDPWARPPVAAPAPATPYPSSAYAPSYAAFAPRFSSLSGLAAALTVLFGLVAIAALYTAMAFFNRASVADDFFVQRSAFSDLEKADDMVSNGSSAWLIATGVMIIVFIVWQFRHAKNAEALRGPLGLGSGWAIGGWFIPFANLVLPAVQLSQSAKASDPTLRPGDRGETGRQPVIVLVWAVLFGLAVLTSIVSSAQRPADESAVVDGRQYVDDYAAADRTSGVAMVFHAGAALAGIVLVRSLTGRQQQAIAGYQAPAPPPPPPPPPPPFQGRF